MLKWTWIQWLLGWCILSDLLQSWQRLFNYSDKQGLSHKDAIFFSPHKFIGGVDSPGKVIVHLLVYRYLFVVVELCSL